MKRKFSPSFRELGACKTIAIILLYITMEILVGKNYRGGGFLIFAQHGGGGFLMQKSSTGGGGCFNEKIVCRGGGLEIFFLNQEKSSENVKKCSSSMRKQLKTALFWKNYLGSRKKLTFFSLQGGFDFYRGRVFGDFAQQGGF